MRKLTKVITVAAISVMVFSMAACGKSEGTGSGNSVLSSTQDTTKDSTQNAGESKTEATTQTANNAEAPTLAIPATGTTYQGTGYTLTAPADWAQGQASGTDIVLYDTKGAVNTTFVANLNVTIEDVSAYGTSFTADSYLLAAKTQFQKSPDTYTIISDGRYNVNGYNATSLICQVKQGTATYYCKQIYVVAKGNTYVITYASATQAGLDDAEAASVMASFKVN